MYAAHIQVSGCHSWGGDDCRSRRYAMHHNLVLAMLIKKEKEKENGQKRKLEHPITMIRKSLVGSSISNYESLAAPKYRSHPKWKRIWEFTLDS